MIRKVALVLCSFLIAYSANILTVRAQNTLETLGDGSGQGSVWFELDPQTPGPYETVTIRFVTYSGDLKTAAIAWFVNDTPYDAGIGLRAITLKTGSVGESLPVKVIVRLQNGQTLTHSITIVPARVTLTWEATSYTPPFYRGKALRGVNQDVFVVGSPHIIHNNKLLKPNELLFEWYVGPNKQPFSGVGKQRVTIPGTSLKIYNNVRLVVSSLDRSATAESYLSIPTTLPQLTLYEVNPLYGKIYERSLGTDVFSGTGEFSVVAEPYFFDKTRVENGSVAVTWTLPGNNTPAVGTIQTFTPKSGAKGAINLTVQATDPNNLFMQSSFNTTIRYGEEKRTLF